MNEYYIPIYRILFVIKRPPTYFSIINSFQSTRKYTLNFIYILQNRSLLRLYLAFQTSSTPRLTPSTISLEINQKVDVTETFYKLENLGGLYKGKININFINNKIEISKVINNKFSPLFFTSKIKVFINNFKFSSRYYFLNLLRVLL